MHRIVNIKIALIIMLSLAGTTAFADETCDSVATDQSHEFSVKGELMARGEYREGALLSPTSNTAKFILERTRLLFNYKQPHIEVQLTPQHCGVWGTADGGTFTLRETWAKLDGSGFFAKVGRQSLTYDDERIIGLDDWSMTSAYHDALKLGYEGGGHKIHTVFAYNQNDDNTNGGSVYRDGGQVYKAMQLLWYHYDFSPTFGASALFVNTGMQAADSDGTINQQLVGGYAKFAPRNISLEASYYCQMGHNEFTMPIKAWMWSAEGNWNFAPNWNFNLGYYHLSGDKHYYTVIPSKKGTNDLGNTESQLIRQTHAHAFNLIFGSHHQFYGAMEFFYLTDFYGGYSPGLQDLHTGFQYKKEEHFSIDANYHLLSTSVKLPGLRHTLGHELELSASWKFLDCATLSAGYSYMDGTHTMKAIKQPDDRSNLNWAWIMLVVKPEFFGLKF